jgi:hypothetical protein
MILLSICMWYQSGQVHGMTEGSKGVMIIISCILVYLATHVSCVGLMRIDSMRVYYRLVEKEVVKSGRDC